MKMSKIKGKMPDFRIGKLRVQSLKEQAKASELIWEQIMKQFRVVNTFVQTKELGWISEKLFKQKIVEGFKFEGVEIK